MIIQETKALLVLCVDTVIASSNYTNEINCVGSKCMAWKWVDKSNGYGCCGKVYPNKEDKQ